MTTPQWTNLGAIRAQLNRKWVSGSLAKQYVSGAAFTPISVLLKGPTSQEIVQNLTRVREWASRLERDSKEGKLFRLESKRVGNAGTGFVTIPARVHFERAEQVWATLAVRDDIATLDELLGASAHRPEVGDWIRNYPLKAIQLAPEWARVILAFDWLEWNRDSGKYLRQIDTPGVDTKFVEQHRGILAAMLGVSKSAEGFVSDLGLARKPAQIRMRFDPLVLGLPETITEGVFRTEELATINANPNIVLIIENEVSYLSVPIPRGAVVIWGRGYDVAELRKLPWLYHSRVLYWGDIDTHGFKILHRVRTAMPHIESVLMDRATLTTSQASWGTEPTPVADALPTLTEAEEQLYSDLVTNRFGKQVRLEQERINWDLVLTSLGGAGFGEW